MTVFLAEEAGKVISVDVDRNMALLAAEAVKGCDNVTLMNQDILKNKNTLAPEICDLIRAQVASLPNGQLKLVSNLPYSVATPVIANLIASDLPWERMVCTIQWELGEKWRRNMERRGTRHCQCGFNRRQVFAFCEGWGLTYSGRDQR